jgi:hypothetical protein
MSRFSISAAALTLYAFTTVAVAQDATNTMPHAHSAMTSPDARELLHFPAAMESSFLGNMRDHMQTLDVLLQSVASGDFASAARTASDRLGLDSPSAAGCKSSKTGAAQSTSQSSSAPAGSMDEMMALFMPEAMRDVGYSMHAAASEFAVITSQAKLTKDLPAVVEALSRVTQNCVACHTAYRLR